MINGHIDDSDRLAIHSAARSFRKGAPIIVDDIKFACRVDGHPVDHINGHYIAQCLSEICTSDPAENRQRASWRLRA